MLTGPGSYSESKENTVIYNLFFTHHPPHTSLPFRFPLLSLPVLGYIDRTWVIFESKENTVIFNLFSTHHPLHTYLAFLFPLLSLPVLAYVDRTYITFRVKREHYDLPSNFPPPPHISLWGGLDE